MALTKPTPTTQTPATDAAAAVKAVGSFESMDETTTATPAANETTAAAAPAPAAQEAAAPAPAAPAVSLPAVKQGGAVAAVQPPSEFAQAVSDMKNAANFAYGNFDVFKGVSGAVKGTGDNKVSFGRWVRVSMLAWGERLQVSPGSDSPAAKDAVAYSSDSVTIESVIGREKYGAWVGRKVTDYVAFLKDNDWPDAAPSAFIDVACIVHEGESAASKEMAGETICVSLSKSSIPSFSKYQSDLEMKAKAIKRGGILASMVKVPEDPFTFYFVAEPAEKPGMAWTKLKVTAKLPVF